MSNQLFLNMLILQIGRLHLPHPGQDLLPASGHLDLLAGLVPCRVDTVFSTVETRHAMVRARVTADKKPYKKGEFIETSLFRFVRPHGICCCTALAPFTLK